MQKLIDSSGYFQEEAKAAKLAVNYEPHFAPLVGKEIKLLELGVQKGASLLFWRDYFENGTIVGVDCNPVHIDDPTGVIHIYQGYQNNIALLDRIATEQAPEGFDVIIDDCSHIGRLTRVSFWHLFQNHLKPGGLYAIEDWKTGYWDRWPDGRRYKPKSQILYSRKDDLLGTLDSKIAYGPRRLKRIRFPFKWFIGSKISSHTYGMVGFIKELIDAYVLGEIAIPKSGNGRYLHYNISDVNIRPFVVIITKSTNESRKKIIPARHTI